MVTGPAPFTGPTRLIEDRYIVGTQLRLRLVTVEGEAVRKLTQKVRPRPEDPFEVAITTMYLEPKEYTCLLGLRAAVLRKTRRECHVEGIRFVIDEFHGDLSGLTLSEVEVQQREGALPRPAWLGREVSDDERFTGGRLASASREEAAQLCDAQASEPLNSDAGNASPGQRR